MEASANPTAIPGAAVALIVAAEPAKLLLIRRAAHPLDPWSGHVALPGGRIDPEDLSSLDAAIRETFEEVGIVLEQSLLRTSLPPTTAFAGTARPRFQVDAHVFRLSGLPDVRPAPGEVAEAFWVPLAELQNPARATAYVLESQIPGVSQARFPALGYEGHIIWGLTYSIVRQFLELVPRFGDF
jgi:8-oxo-dGTP pyrophosphatase MutT (NUDIX family)